MATDNGFPDQKKSSGRAQHVTVGPIREQQWGYDVRAHAHVTEIADDTAETGSTTTAIKATAHAAIAGDVILFSTGNLAKSEYAVMRVETDWIYPVEEMREAPANGNAFTIQRFKHPKVDADGNLAVTAASGAVAFNLDGSLEEVNEDTGTPANNIPLPVKLMNETGDLIGQQAMANSVPVVISSDQSAVDVAQSGTWNITDITGTVSLPTGAATEAKQDDAIALLTAIEADTTSIATSADAIEASASAIATDTGNIATDTSAIAADTGTIATDTGSIDGKLVQLALDNGATSGALRVVPTTTNVAYSAKGKITGSSLTGTYATLLNPTSDLKILHFFNSCNATILVSLDGGSTDSFELEAAESFSLDLAANGLKFDNAVNISAKHNGAAPTSGTIRVSGVG